MSYAIPMPYIPSPDAADAVKASTTTRVKKSRDHNIHVIERSDREIDILLPAGAEQLTLQQLEQSSSLVSGTSGSGLRNLHHAPCLLVLCSYTFSNIYH